VLAAVTVAASVVRKKSKKKKKKQLISIHVEWDSEEPTDIIHEPLATGGPYKSSWSIYAEVLPFLLVFFIDHVSRSRIRSSICVRVQGIWVAVAPRIQRCFLQSIATRFVRKLSSRASGVGRSSAKRMYVHSFYVIHTHTYTFYVRIFKIYTPVILGYQHHPLQIPAGYFPGHTHSRTHTHTHIYRS
jgi:hypothetical protein